MDMAIMKVAWPDLTRMLKFQAVWKLLFLHVCVCVCVTEGERETVRHKQTETERGKQTDILYRYTNIQTS